SASSASFSARTSSCSKKASCSVQGRSASVCPRGGRSPPRSRARAAVCTPRPATTSSWTPRRSSESTASIHCRWTAGGSASPCGRPMRIRPAEMWPYDYHAEQYTPLLWWSEGVTDYYSDLTNIRSGLWTADQFLNNAAQDMQQVESAPEPWSEEDGSVATWIKEVFVNSSQLYYP